MAYRNKILLIVALIIIILVLFFNLPKREKALPVQNISTSTSTSTSEATTSIPQSIPNETIVASNLNIPWDLAFLPQGSILVTERVGNLVEITPDGKKKSIKLPHPVPKGEGGLLGIVLHPNFKQNKFLYLYMTTQEDSEGTRNAVFRYTFENSTLAHEKIIIKDIPGALYHDGGRMEFGPDGLLYITTGDAQSSHIAQNLSSLGGKILRIHEDGGIPQDNPHKTAVYSYGHRNPQGLAWDMEGRLWETEHGRSGVTSGFDEINLIEKGKNYGWPTIEGDAKKDGLLPPAAHSGSKLTWAPASALFYKGNLFFGGLKGEALYEAVLEGEKVVEVKTHLLNKYGRIRTIRLGPDQMFYITTSNRDGRGNPVEGDDKIIRLNPSQFF